MLRQHISQLALISRIPAPQTTPLIPQPLPHKAANISPSRHLRPAQRTERDYPSIPRSDIQIPLKIPPTDKVHHNIDPLPTRLRQNLPRPILRV